MRELSERQQKIVDFIQRFWADRHYPPTVRDIVSGCKISSTSVVDYNLDILEREGYIRRHSGISRGIELLIGAVEMGIRVPMIGLIAAGSPIPVPSADTWDPAASAETIDVSPGASAFGSAAIRCGAATQPAIVAAPPARTSTGW